MTPLVDKRVAEIGDCFLQHSDDDGFLSWDTTSDYSDCVNRIIERTGKASPQYRARILLAALEEVLRALGSADDSYGNLGVAISNYAETLQTLVEQHSTTFSAKFLHEMLKRARKSRSEAKSWGIDESFNTLLTVLTEIIEEREK